MVKNADHLGVFFLAHGVVTTFSNSVVVHMATYYAYNDSFPTFLLKIAIYNHAYSITIDHIILNIYRIAIVVPVHNPNK